MVQEDKIGRIRSAWEAKGSPPCDHPDLDKVYGLGADSGDKVCMDCGKRFYEQEWRALGR